MGISCTVNAAGRPIVARAVIEGAAKSECHAGGRWKSRKTK